ncbi:DUF6452 family protein [Prevotella sp. KH2C16]|uniref:DUF6452 family protein n=1 Tax=Prevotella sp. KH2C16 TaxID=1855325 RepID=UPI0008EFDAF6|nr:DUF6452 family protein [Prevotella sp. KH2C16]SFG15382.1 hypothetical protein SAMN05216383_10617 [Prevotella sp. KH2C16]
MQRIIRPLFLSLILLAMVSCASIDCPLNNMVYAKFKFAKRVTDTLTVAAEISDGRDSILFNRGVDVDSIQLPMSYSRSQDVYYFEFKDSVSTKTDKITVSKEDRPHFESVDCNPSVFHTITGVSTTHNVIDSIAVNNKDVTYDARKPHLIIYLKGNSD